ncbi:MAG TPA: glycosyltransferase family 39 protein [Thermoanaerobaculia bacterium]|nr:glycosyltransferase family 39 protein [Thermoanaerobaculia bacterium]
MEPAPEAHRGRPRGLRALLPGLAVALAFLLVGLAVLDDYGVTWDENESYRAGLQNLHNLPALATDGSEIEWPWHELRGYQFLFDTVRAAFALAVAPLWDAPGEAVLSGAGLAPVPIRAFHLFHLLLSAATLFVTYRVAVELSGRVRVGVLSALVLATMPRFVAHSQNNPKDSIGLLVFTFALWAVARATRADREWAPFAWAGAAMGLAFASHVLAALLVPIAAAWVLWRRPGALRRRLAALALLFAVAGAVAFLLWPWLWPDPVIRTARVLRRIATYRVEIDVLYLGRVYPWADPPWHYFLVHLLASTPVAFTLSAVLGAWKAVRRGSTQDRQDEGREEVRRGDPLARFSLLWLVIPITIEAFAGARYDGVRHLLVVLPALALLAGVGLDRLLGLARQGGPAPPRLFARLALGLAAVAWGWLAVDLVRYHPYQDAYLNPPVRAAAGRSAPELFELEYWGASFKEGAAWLNRHAPPGSRVLVPIAPHCAAPYLDPGLVLVAPDPDVTPPETDPEADYLMAMTRTAMDTPGMREVRARREPVFTVTRLGSTLLEVYRLDVRSAPDVR